MSRKGIWLKKLCTICGKGFETPLYQEKRKTCSVECRYKQVSISAKNSENSGRFNSSFVPWNKGLTKKDDRRLQIISQKSKEQMEREYVDGTRDRFEITKNANEKCRKLVKDGNWILQNLDNDIRQQNNKINCEKLKSEGRLGFQNPETQAKAQKTMQTDGYKNNMSHLLSGKNNPNYGKLPSPLSVRGKGCHYNSPLQGKVWLRSSYELAYAKYLDSINEPYYYELKTFDLGDITYTPDFYLPKYCKFIEIKGYMTDKAEEKIDRFIAQYHCHNFEILKKEDLIKLGVNL